MNHVTSRRRIVTTALGLAATGAAMPSMPRAAAAGNGAEAPVEVVVSLAPNAQTGATFDREVFGVVGIYDGDWFGQPEFSRLLDNLAASPGAFHGVRFFGIFTSGSPERYLPEDAGTVWTRADGPMDFSGVFDALEALTSRGLVPWIPLGFFPPAVSASMVQPPPAWDAYQTLVRAFLTGLAEDPRFGEERIADWWFEAWNEPNEGRFWTGTLAEYFDLFRATSEAIAQTGLSIRFGGPAIAYKPQVSPDDGAPWMGRFLRFLAREPDVQCDFISYHRKGTVTDDPPDPRLMFEAAVATADQMLAIDAGRFAGMVIVNDEADEKVGFENPYAPRLDERNAAWLGTVAAIHGGLNDAYASAGFRFIGVADNANLQLVEAPFDGRRSIMTYARDGTTDLLKLPAYAFYELLPLFGDRLGSVIAGAARLFPATDIHHLTAFADTHAGCLVTWYPEPEDEASPPRTVEIAVADIPWPRVNVARFQIDRELSNSYAAAGGSERNPFPTPDPADLGRLRQAQELAEARPISRDVAVDGGVYRERIELAPFRTVMLWITSFEQTVPAPPEWISVEPHDGNAVLRWTPSREPGFYSYEVFPMRGGEPGDRFTPFPLRAAMWVDTAPPGGPRVYGVRAVTASGMTSAIVPSDEMILP